MFFKGLCAGVRCRALFLWQFPLRIEEMMKLSGMEQDREAENPTKSVDFINLGGIGHEANTA